MSTWCSTFDSGEQQVFRLGHSRRLNARGLTAGLTYMMADSNPQGVVAVLDLATDVQLFHVERSWRDAMLGSIGAGTSEVQRSIIARDLLPIGA